MKINHNEYTIAVRQIKQRLGKLSMFITVISRGGQRSGDIFREEIQPILEQAQEMSISICEVCGSLNGKLRVKYFMTGPGWNKTLCGWHYILRCITSLYRKVNAAVKRHR